MDTIFVAEFHIVNIKRGVIAESWVAFASEDFYELCDQTATMLAREGGSSVETLSWEDGERASYSCVDYLPKSFYTMQASIYPVSIIRSSYGKF